MAQSVVEQPSLEQLVHEWREVLQRSFKAHLQQVALGYPVTRSVYLEYGLLDRQSSLLAEQLLERPWTVLGAAKRSLEEIDLPSVPLEKRSTIHIRLTKLIETARVKVRDLRAAHLGRFIAVEGLVKRASEVQPRVEESLWKCKACDAVIPEQQDEQMVLLEPIQCYPEEGGCGRSKGFELLTEKSRFVDTQILEIQESPESLRGGEQPQRLTLVLEDDLCGLVAPGDRIIANGILRASPKRQGSTKSTLFRLHLRVVSTEVQQQAYEEVSVTPEDEAEIARIARDPRVYERLVRSIAPTIFGMDVEKEALVLQLFGGVEKLMRDRTRIRGDIHILLVGDPGVAKTQLLRYAGQISPRGIYTSGKASTAAGLTATAVRDETDGRWSLEAGALVLADRGLACIDEMDKMDEQDRSAMHEVLEQGTVSVAKAGITAQLNARCSVLGAANPKDGRFDTKFGTIAEQIDMPPTLLSRFDVIFPMTDKPHPEMDRLLAGHILRSHRAGEISAYRAHHGEQGLYSAGEEEAAMAHLEPPFPPELLRKYVAYARRSTFPVLTAEAQARLGNYYVELRKQASGDNGGPIPLTPRQLEALVRMAEASARVRLGHEVAVEDVERAIRIMEYYLRKVAAAEGGLFDIDLIASGVGHTQRDRIHRLLGIVEELGQAPEGAPLDAVLQRAREQGIADADARYILDRLTQEGRLFQPRGDHYRRTPGR